MDKPDARYLTKDVQEYLRRQAIHLRKQGETFVAISRYLGVHRNTVSDWWQLYLKDGDAALHQYHRGRVQGEGRQLSPSHEQKIQQLIVNHSPDELGVDIAVWTRRAVQQLMKQQLKIHLPIRTVGSYLKRWKFTPQKPLKRAYEQEPKQVSDWLHQDYPRLEQRAQQEAADIIWGDESGRCNQDQVGRSFSPQGQTPAIHLTAKTKSRINYIAGLNHLGKIWFMTYIQTFDSSTFIEFMRRLIRQVKTKVFWIVDRHPVHRSSEVQRWLAKHRDRIELYFLPAYSPELNPAEYLNGDVKYGTHSAPPSRSLKELRDRVSSHLYKLQKLPQRIISYFQHPCIAYASGNSARS